jgi:hypothetical protein
MGAQMTSPSAAEFRASPRCRQRVNFTPPGLGSKKGLYGSGETKQQASKV